MEKITLHYVGSNETDAVVNVSRQFDATYLPTIISQFAEFLQQIGYTYISSMVENVQGGYLILNESADLRKIGQELIAQADELDELEDWDDFESFEPKVQALKAVASAEEFVIGQHVRCVRNLGPSCYNSYVGREGTVTSGGTDPLVQFDGDVISIVCPQGELEAVEDKTFKVGDRVIVTKASAYGETIKVGLRGTVTKVKGFTTLVSFDNHEAWDWYFNDEEDGLIEKITEAHNEIKVGAEVKVVKDLNTTGYSKWVGQQGVVTLVREGSGMSVEVQLDGKMYSNCFAKEELEVIG